MDAEVRYRRDLPQYIEAVLSRTATAQPFLSSHHLSFLLLFATFANSKVDAEGDREGKSDGNHT